MNNQNTFQLFIVIIIFKLSVLFILIKLYNTRSCIVNKPEEKMHSEINVEQ